MIDGSPRNKTQKLASISLKEAQSDDTPILLAFGTHTVFADVSVLTRFRWILLIRRIQTQSVEFSRLYL